MRERLVETVEDLSVEQFTAHYLIPRRPVVLRGFIREWPALHKWTPEFWISRYGEKRVGINGKRYALRDVIRLALESSDESPAPYYKNVVLQSQFPELVQDISPIPACARANWLHSWLFRLIRPITTSKFGYHYELFIGGAGRTFPYMHYDDPGTDTFSSQIVGRKQWTLFSPIDSEYLYPGSESRFMISQVRNPFDVDLSRFPLFENVTRYTAEVGPGDTMFIPCGWWHTAKNLTFSVGVATDMLNQSNWDHFLQYQYRKVSFHKRSRLLAPLYLCYLEAAGVLLNQVPSERLLAPVKPGVFLRAF